MNNPKSTIPSVSRLLLAAAFLTVSLATQPARAQLYNIDGGTASSPVYTGAGVLGADGDLWNGYYPGDWVGSPAFVSVFDSTGNTSAGVQFAIWNNSGASYWTSGTTANPADLMSDYIQSPGWGAGDGWPIKVQFNNLPASTAFNLVVYSAGDTAGQGATLTLFDSSGNLVQTTSGASRDISEGAGVAYGLFSGTTLADGSVYLEVKTTTDDWHALNGLQLQVVPEPSSLALGIGGIVLLGWSRRRAVR